MKCPFCSEEIQDTAAKCRFCGEFLQLGDFWSARRRSSWAVPGFGVVLGAIGGFLTGMFLLVEGCGISMYSDPSAVFVVILSSFMAIAGAVFGFGVGLIARR